MIYFLTESGKTTGLGHLYRSINLTHTLKKQNKIGGQNKVPRLSNDRKKIEELLHFL